MSNESPSTGLNIVSFLIPIVGLILYLTNKDNSPACAKSYGKWALIGFCVGFVFSIISTVLLAFV